MRRRPGTTKTHTSGYNGHDRRVGVVALNREGRSDVLDYSRTHPHGKWISCVMVHVEIRVSTQLHGAPVGSEVVWNGQTAVGAEDHSRTIAQKDGIAMARARQIRARRHRDGRLAWRRSGLTPRYEEKPDGGGRREHDERRQRPPATSAWRFGDRPDGRVRLAH